MSKWSIVGGLCWVLAGVIILFQIVGNMIKESYDWEMMTLVDTLDGKYLNWIDKVTVPYVGQTLDYIVTMPLYLLLLVLGGICFLFSIFYKGR